jgi:hypothetical protein
MNKQMLLHRIPRDIGIVESLRQQRCRDFALFNDWRKRNL